MASRDFTCSLSSCVGVIGDDSYANVLCHYCWLLDCMITSTGVYVVY